MSSILQSSKEVMSYTFQFSGGLVDNIGKSAPMWPFAPIGQKSAGCLAGTRRSFLSAYLCTHVLLGRSQGPGKYFAHLSTCRLGVGPESAIGIAAKDTVSRGRLDVGEEARADCYIREGGGCRANQGEPCCLHYDLGYLAPCHLTERVEGAVCVAADKPMAVSRFDVGVEGVADRHITEVPLA